MTTETFDLDQLDLFAQTEGLRLEDVCEDFSRIRFIDLESSGLGRGSYPIEYGSCGFDLRPLGFLIRRREDFKLSEWSPAAQSLHNISVDQLAEQGIDTEEAILRISHDLGPGVVSLSDNPDYDCQWLLRLSPDLDSVDIYPISLFQRQAQITALERHGYDRLSQATEKVRERYPHVHRAGPDSLRAAALFKLLIDDEYVEHILSR